MPNVGGRRTWGCRFRGVDIVRIELYTDFALVILEDDSIYEEVFTLNGHHFWAERQDFIREFLPFIVDMECDY